MACARPPISAVDAPLRRLLVTGEPVHAWMIAARLARALGAHGVHVWVLEDGNAPSPGVLCFDPDIHAFHRSLGVERRDLLRHLRASTRYGTHFRGWSTAGQDGFAGFGSAGQLIERIPFQHYVTALRGLRPEARLADFSPAALAARAGRFALEGHGPLAGLDAGLCVEGADYIAFLRALARDLGVEQVVGRVQRIESDADGDLQSLVLEDGRRLTADGYFDCTEQASLAGAAGPLERLPFPAEFAIQRRALRETRLEGPAPLFDCITRCEGGWERWRCVGERIEMERVWVAAAPMADTGGATQGLLRTPWRGRCIALGPALGEPGDLAADRWLLARRALAHWLRLLPTCNASPKLRDEFNRAVVAEALRLADAQCLPLYLAKTGTPDSEASICIDEAAASDLRYRIDLYRSSGRLSFHEDDPIPAPRWMMLLEALGVLPEAADRLLPAHPPGELARRMDRVGEVLARAIATLPAHDQALARLRQQASADA